MKVLISLHYEYYSTVTEWGQHPIFNVHSFITGFGMSGSADPAMVESRKP